MSSPTAPTVNEGPLDAVVAADTRLWDAHNELPIQALAERNTAIRQALAAGYSLDDVARAMRVRPADVEHMVGGH